MKSQPPGATPHSAALTGIGLMLVGIFFFALNDALGKWLIATYSVGELLLIRSIAALTLILPFIGRDIRAFNARAATEYPDAAGRIRHP